MILPREQRRALEGPEPCSKTAGEKSEDDAGVEEGKTCLGAAPGNGHQNEKAGIASQHCSKSGEVWAGKAA